MMKLVGVFFKEAITWPGTKYSGSVSFDIGKAGLEDMALTDNYGGGITITVLTNGDLKTTFVPSSNIRCVNLAETKDEA